MTSEEKINNRIKELNAVRTIIRDLENYKGWYVETDENEKTTIQEEYKTEYEVYSHIIDIIIKEYKI